MRSYHDTSFRIEYIEYLYGSAQDGGNYLDMGTVKYGDSILYSYSTSAGQIQYGSPYANPNSIGWSNFFNAGQLWTVSGNTTTSIPALTATNQGIYPTTGNRTFPTKPTINRSSSITVTWDNTIPADSVTVVIYGDNGYTTIESGLRSGSPNSYTFTSSQLQALPPGSGRLQIIGFVAQVIKISDVELILEILETACPI